MVQRVKTLLFGVEYKYSSTRSNCELVCRPKRHLLGTVKVTHFSGVELPFFNAVTKNLVTSAKLPRKKQGVVLPKRHNVDCPWNPDLVEVTRKCLELQVLLHGQVCDYLCEGERALELSSRLLAFH